MRKCFMGAAATALLSGAFMLMTVVAAGWLAPLMGGGQAASPAAWALTQD